MRRLPAASTDLPFLHPVISSGLLPPPIVPPSLLSPRASLRTPRRRCLLPALPPSRAVSIENRLHMLRPAVWLPRPHPRSCSTCVLRTPIPNCLARFLQRRSLKAGTRRVLFTQTNSSHISVLPSSTKSSDDSFSVFSISDDSNMRPTK